MRHLCAFFLTILLCGQSEAQVNLIPNPGFDSIVSCPTNGAQVYKAPPWIDPTSETSDLLNLCGSGNYCEAPSNEYGWQMPYNGSGFVGLSTYVNATCCADVHEYIQSPLLSPLQAGKTYCVSFRVSRADSVQGATDRIGAYFSTNAISCLACLLPYTPQVGNTPGNILTNEIDWSLIQGSFVAQGGEQYITIGNFYSDSFTSYQIIINPTPYPFAYYYIDDVSVIEIAACQAGSDIAICPGDSTFLGIAPMPDVVYSWSPSDGLTDTTISNPVAKPTVTTTYTLTQTQCDVVSTAMVTVTVKTDCDVLPPLIIPSILYGDEMLKITGLVAGASLTVFDLLGRKVFETGDYSGDFGGPNIAAGNYVIWLTMPDGTQYKNKLCIVK